MLRMSKLADYAFILLTHMSSAQGVWTAAALAQETCLPLPTVAKLMKILAKGKIVGAQRGPAGGYQLLQEPKQLSVAQIIEAVDGPIGVTACAGKAGISSAHNCVVGDSCPVKEGWKKINLSLVRALESVTLSDFVSGKKGA